MTFIEYLKDVEGINVTTPGPAGDLYLIMAMNDVGNNYRAASLLAADAGLLDVFQRAWDRYDEAVDLVHNRPDAEATTSSRTGMARGINTTAKKIIATTSGDAAIIRPSETTTTTCSRTGTKSQRVIAAARETAAATDQPPG